MKLYYFPTCPLSAKMRILLRHTYSGLIEIQVKNHATYLSLGEQVSLPAVEHEGRYIYNYISLLFFLKDVCNSYFVLQWMKNYTQQRMDLLLDQDLYYNFYLPTLGEETLKKIYVKNYVSQVEKNKTSNHLKHLNYFNELIKKKPWVWGAEITFSDITLFSHLVTLDYFALVDWQKLTNLKHWYTRMKSNRMFNFLLEDRLDNIEPSSSFVKLDF